MRYVLRGLTRQIFQSSDQKKDQPDIQKETTRSLLGAKQGMNEYESDS